MTLKTIAQEITMRNGFVGSDKQIPTIKSVNEGISACLSQCTYYVSDLHRRRDIHLHLRLLVTKSPASLLS